MKKTFLILTISLSLISFSKVFAEEVPTIVISAGKTPQSLSTVGTNVTVISGDTIRNSSENFLGNIIDGSTSSTNLFQMGGDKFIIRAVQYGTDTPSARNFRTTSGSLLFLAQFLLPEVAQHIIGIVRTFRVAPVSHFFRSGPSISASWPNSKGSAIALRRARVATLRAAARPQKIVRYLPCTCTKSVF